MRPTLFSGAINLGGQLVAKIINVGQCALLLCAKHSTILGFRMAKKLTHVAVYGKRGTRGKRIKTGQGWRLVRVRGNKQFVGSLLRTVKVGDETIAIFRLRKYSD